MVKMKVIAFFLFLFIFSLLFTQKVHAIFDCLTLTTSSNQSDKDYCRNELTQIEMEYASLVKQLESQNKQSSNYASEVKKLTLQINALKAKIKARGLVIAQLKVNIAEKVSAIQSLNSKINREHESLAQLLRNTNEFDEETLVHLILSDESISNFYSDLESYDSIKQAIKNSVDVIRGVKTQTEVVKSDLEKKQNAEIDAKAELESAQKSVAKTEADQKQLLAISKNKEAEYQKLAAEKKAKADSIRSALFSLAGISEKIEFGTALEYANEAKTKTGIDPAFLLAILTQESNLGANVGQCYLTDPNTGAGVGKNTGTPFTKVMHPTRDVPIFFDITNSLGFNAFKTAVSCPIAGVVGWGGAMGPAQFIPSTWKGIASSLKNLLGYIGNPWSPRDSFIASAIHLTNLGAVGTSTSAQNKAACRYYGSGVNSAGTCSYGRSVMSLKAKIQDNIDLLSS